MRKNKFIKIILAFSVVFNMVIAMPVRAGDDDPTELDQQKITFYIYYNCKLHHVWIKEEAVISKLDDLLKKSLNYVFKGGVLNKNSVAKDVLVEGAIVGAFDINDKTNFVQAFQDFLSENSNFENERLVKMLASPEERNFICHIKDVRFFKEMGKHKNKFHRMGQSLRNYASPVIISSRPQVPTVINNGTNLLGPSTEPLPAFWDD